ncbi:ureidoglycolate lyase [candidate division KSB1 bacterium]|nr:ureidoglycolate lyase [candidate division KSB1 bacterium]
MKIKSNRINKENFNKFGTVIIIPSGYPNAQTEDYKFWSDIGHYQIDGKTEIGICTVFKHALNRVTTMERHKQTPEILIPIDAPFVVPLLSDNDVKTPIQAFQVNIGEGIIINNGVWHGPAIPVGQDQSSYFVIFRLGTPHQDVDELNITPVIIDI